MAVLNNSNAISPSGYDVNNSLRFRASASAYLSRTPASAGNRQIWTWSAWVKRGAADGAGAQMLFGVNTGAGAYSEIRTLSDKFCFQDNSFATEFQTNAVLRDYSAWYHLMFVIDTTQATSTNRIKAYINGVEQTFAAGSYPSQNATLTMNTTNAHNIGRRPTGVSYFDGYIAEQYFIDGSAKTPSDFGSTDTTTGVWKPKAYSGTYGTNGFYLKFSDIATTSGSNAGLGKDFSGNTNYWTTNNISVTSGTTYDAMIDSPTLTSATVANYAVMNPLNQNTSITLTEANLRVTSSGSPNKNVFCTMDVPKTEKIYFEVNVVTGTSVGNYFAVGIAPSTLGLSTEIGIGSGSFSIESDQATASLKRISGTGTSYGAGTNFATGNVLQVAIDQANGKIWFGKNNTWFDSGNPSAGTNPATSTLSTTEQYFIGTTFYIDAGTPPVLAFNFGQRPFSYTPPTGFVRLNTYNLPTPTVLKGNTVMDAVLWTGNGTTGTGSITGLNFKPDFVWAKMRSSAISHALFNSVVGGGANKGLCSNTTDSEASFNDNSTNGYLSSFNSDGFSYFGGSSPAYFSSNGNTYVGWAWQAGQGSTSSITVNQYGSTPSIASTVSVNTTAGFSIVTYTGTGANATVGHGLGVAPKMIIVKQRSGATSWNVYHTSLGAGNLVYLEATNASTASSTTWNNTSPTSTVFSIGTAAGPNTNTGTYVAYCWAAIAGYSAFGSYTGNGSADGPFVYTGFRPKYVLIKVSSTTGNWQIMDSVRNSYNVANSTLFPNDASAQATDTNRMLDFLSNGFKLRSTLGEWNGSGSTFIYAAFAENPFKNSNAR